MASARVERLKTAIGAAGWLSGGEDPECHQDPTARLVTEGAGKGQRVETGTPCGGSTDAGAVLLDCANTALTDFYTAGELDSACTPNPPLLLDTSP